MKKYLFLINILFTLISHYPQTEGKEYFFVFLNSNPDRENLPEGKVLELQEGHMNNIGRLAKEGKLIVAGPVKGGGGIFILSAASLDEAYGYLGTDPAIKANRFKLEVYPMEILAGNICTVKEDDFEMINYSLIRYADSISFKEEDKILVSIKFKGSTNGVIILNYDLEKGTEKELNHFFSTDSLVYFKTLWAAKGSFCK